MHFEVLSIKVSNQAYNLTRLASNVPFMAITVI